MPEIVEYAEQVVNFALDNLQTNLYLGFKLKSNFNKK